MGSIVYFPIVFTKTAYRKKTMQRLLIFLLATPLAVTLAVDVSYQDADTNNDNKISGTECAALDIGNNIVVGSNYVGSVDIGSGSGDDCSRITVDLSQATGANSISIGNNPNPVCLSSDATLGSNVNSIHIYDQNCNTNFEIGSQTHTTKLILKSTCAPYAHVEYDCVLKITDLDIPETCDMSLMQLYPVDDEGQVQTLVAPDLERWRKETMTVYDVSEDIKNQIRTRITKDEVPEWIKDEIIAGIAVSEVPASVVAAINAHTAEEAVAAYVAGMTKADIPFTLVEAIEQEAAAEAVAAMTPEEHKTAYETKVVQQACPL